MQSGGKHALAFIRYLKSCLNPTSYLNQQDQNKITLQNRHMVYVIGIDPGLGTGLLSKSPNELGPSSAMLSFSSRAISAVLIIVHLLDGNRTSDLSDKDHILFVLGTRM